MKKYKVLYSDKTFSDRREVFETKPYPRPQAEELKSILSLMGCGDFEFVPVAEAA